MNDVKNKASFPYGFQRKDRNTHIARGASSYLIAINSIKSLLNMLMGKHIRKLQIMFGNNCVVTVHSNWHAYCRLGLHFHKYSAHTHARINYHVCHNKGPNSSADQLPMVPRIPSL